MIEFPSLIKSSPEPDRDSEAWLNRKSPIENPWDMGIDKLAGNVFQNCKLNHDYFDPAETARRVLLGLESDPDIIRDRQLTMSYFLGNNALRSYVNDTVPPKCSHYPDLANPFKFAFGVFKDKQIMANYLRGLERQLTNLPSESLQAAKRTLREIIDDEVFDLEKNIEVRENSTLVLSIPKHGDLLISIEGCDDTVLENSIVKSEDYAVLEPYIDGLRKIASDVEYDSIDIKVTGMKEVKIEKVLERNSGEEETTRETGPLRSLFARAWSRLKKPEDNTDNPVYEPEREELEVPEGFRSDILEQLGGKIELSMTNRYKANGVFGKLCWDFKRFWTDLSYYVHMANYFHELKEQGLPVFMPEIAPIEENKIQVKNGYGFNLIPTMPPEQVVPNDINIGENGVHIYLVTGPVFSGKTSFINMIGGDLAAFQAGWPLVCDYARISPRASVKSYYPRVVNESDQESTFSVQAEQIRGTFQDLRDYTLIPIDEPVRSADREFIEKYLPGLFRDVFSQTPNVIYIVTSHEHSLIPLVEELPNAQNLRCDPYTRFKIVPGYSTESNSNELMRERGADIPSLVGYLKKGAQEGRLSLG